MKKAIIDGKAVFAKQGELLSEILTKHGFDTEHICGGKGRCKKCRVLVNGKEELSCQYKIENDIVVEAAKEGAIYSESGLKETGKKTENMALVLDLGTTTLALCLVSIDEKKAVKVIGDVNPQRKYGADVMSRIDYSIKHGVDIMQKELILKINEMKEKLCDQPLNLYVAGNATMLHIFLGVKPDTIGVAPYKAEFLEEKRVKGYLLGLKDIEDVIALPSISSFVGADLVAGLNFVGLDNQYNILLDLGTNAEIVIYNENRVLCTAAAAGPCFEGANISMGMSATEGAIYKYGNRGFKTIGDKKAVGICGTGLVDIISVLLNEGIIDETGFMEEEKYSVAEGVYITRKDIREYQSAKSAICAGIMTLMDILEISCDDIKTLYLSGGFSTKIDVDNAVFTGLFPKELKDKCKSIGNSSLSGAVKFVCEDNDLRVYTKDAEYVDLANEKRFSELFIENMIF